MRASAVLSKVASVASINGLLLFFVAACGCLMLLLSATAFIIGDIAGTAQSRLSSLNSKTLALSVGDIKQTNSQLWRQVYEVRQLVFADPAGGWRVTLPRLYLELDPLRSLLGLQAHIRSVSMDEAVQVELSPWKLQPSDQPIDPLELVQLMEQVAGAFRIDSVSVPDIRLRVHGRASTEFTEYHLTAAFGRAGGQAHVSLQGTALDRQVLQLRGRWQQGGNWLMHLQLQQLALQRLLSGPLHGIALTDLTLNADLLIQGTDRPVPEQMTGSLAVSDLRANNIPWPIAVDVPRLIFGMDTAELGSLSLQLPQLTGRIGDENIAVDDLSLHLQADPGLLQLNIKHQELRRLAELVVALVELPEDIAKNMLELQLTGELSQVSFVLPLDAPAGFAMTARLQNMNAQPTSNSWPGFSGISGEISATASGGVLQIRDVADATLNIPDYFDLWHINDVSGLLGWKVYPDSVLISGDQLHLRIGGGQLRGRISVVLPLIPTDEAARLEAMLEGENLDATAAWLYTPKLPGLLGLVAYLKEAVLSGKAQLRGTSVWADLRAGGDTNLHMQVAVQDGGLKYAPDWPPVTQAVAEVEILQDEVFVKAQSGLISGVRAGPGNVWVGAADRPGWVQVNLDGDFNGDMSGGIDFLLNSSLKEYMQPALEGAWGSGEVSGRINKGVVLLPPETDPPLEVETEVNITANLNDVRLTWVDWAVDIWQLNGRVTLDTYDNVHSEGLRGRIFDKPVDIQIGGEGPLGEAGSFSFFDIFGGAVNADDMYDYIGDWNRFLEGTLNYQGRLLVPYGDDAVVMTAHSDTLGMLVNVPSPVLKSAIEEIPTTMTLRIPAGEDDPVRIQLVSGEICTDLTFINDNLGGDMWFNDLAACEQSALQPRAFAPLQIFGSLQAVSVGEQVDLIDRMPLDPDSESTLGRISVAVEALEMAGLTFTNLQIEVLPVLPGTLLAVPGKELNGAFVAEEIGSVLFVSGEDLHGWSFVPDGEESIIQTQLDYMRLDEGYDRSARNTHDDPQNIGPSDTYIRNLHYRGIEVGELRVKTRRVNGNIEVSLPPVERSILSVSPNSLSPDSLLDLVWQFAPEEKIGLTGHFVIDGEGSSVLQMFEVPGLTRLGSVGVDAQVGWLGGLTDFAVENLRGDLQMQILDTALDTAAAGIAGQLLTATSVLNLGDLLGSLATFKLHRISGTWFKEIGLRLFMENNRINVRELRAIGSGSHIYARGTVDLPKGEETSPVLDLALQVRLPVVKAIPWYLAALGNVSGGVALYLLNLLLGKPLDRAAVLSMRLGGTFAEPEMTPQTDVEDYQALPIWMEDFSEDYEGSVVGSETNR